MAELTETRGTKKLSLRRLAPLAVLVAVLALALGFDLQRYLDFESLKTYRGAILAWTAGHAVLAVAAFVAAYAVMAAVSLPGATLMTMIGGYLFGTVFGGISVVIGATIGATVVFLAVRYAFAEYFYAKSAAAVKKMERGFQDNALFYMLFLRLNPVFAFWLVNLVPALLNVRLGTFVVATFFGIMPGTFVYASLGSGLGAIIDRGGEPDFAVIFKPEIFVPLVLVALLSLVPALARIVKARRANARRANARRAGAG
jgi:uncharacterized membrane protein YdjX (TVP38/TMEM64 family)